MSADRLFDLTDRVVVVTGALGQLGRAFTIALADRGARVAALDVAAGDAAFVRECFGERADDDALLVRACDVTSRTDLEAALDAVTDRWAVPHALVNNAGLDSPPGVAGQTGPFEDFPEDAFDRVMDVNTKGPFLATQVFGGAMRRAARGSIVNISSIYGMLSPDQSIYDYLRTRGETFYKPVAYAVSKSALLNLTRYTATYFAPHVRVNTLTLAGVFNDQDPEFLAAYCGRIPSGRMADEHDYDGALVFLVSDASRYMTGANLVVDGGWTAI